jgi:hypothetical protein
MSDTKKDIKLRSQSNDLEKIKSQNKTAHQTNTNNESNDHQMDKPNKQGQNIKPRTLINYQIEKSQAPQSHENTNTNNTMNYTTTKTKRQTKATTINKFFTASKLKIKTHKADPDDSEDSTNSLYYSSSSDSSTVLTTLRPSITIRKNSEIVNSNQQHSNRNPTRERP